MKRYNLIATHGELAEGFSKTLEMFLGENHSFNFLSAYIDESNLSKQIQEIVDSLDNDIELVIFTDIVGGSVNQSFIKYLDRPHTHIISGVNLAMLITYSTFNDQNYLNDEQVNFLINESKESIVYVNKLYSDINFGNDDE